MKLWLEDHPVLELLRQRRRSGSQPGQREKGDNAILGLAVEGGGMRGVVSAAMLAALEDRGFFSAFDAVYGSSSGAINAAYFLGGNTWYPLSIYYDNLATKRFVDFRRVFRGKPIMNLEYVFEEILEYIKPLDYAKIIASPIPLKIAITSVDHIKTIMVDKFVTKKELKDALLATSWLPIGLPGTANFQGMRAVDGGALTQLPFQLALRDNCTHILSLSTHPMGHRSTTIGFLAQFTCQYLNRLQKGLGEAYLAAIRQRRKDEYRLEMARHNPQSPFILDLAPLPNTADVKRHELSYQRLVEAAKSAYLVLYAAVEKTGLDLIETGRLQAIPRWTIAERQDGIDRPFIKFVAHEC